MVFEKGRPFTFILRWCSPHLTGGSTVLCNVRCSGCDTSDCLLLLTGYLMLVGLVLRLLLLLLVRRRYRRRCRAHFSRRAWAVGLYGCCTLFRWTSSACNVCSYKWVQRLSASSSFGDLFFSWNGSVNDRGSISYFQHDIMARQWKVRTPISLTDSLNSIGAISQTPVVGGSHEFSFSPLLPSLREFGEIFNKEFTILSTGSLRVNYRCHRNCQTCQEINRAILLSLPNLRGPEVLKLINRFNWQELIIRVKISRVLDCLV